MTISVKTTTTDEWPSNIDEIENLEYYLEFSPTINDISVANYLVNFSSINESTLNIDVIYSDPKITTKLANFNYNLSVTNNKIQAVNSTIYGSYINNRTTELFLNLTEIGNSQIFRVDEMVTFSPFFRTSGEPDLIEDHELEFEFVGTENIEANESWYTSLTIYHYSTNYSWIGDGCT